MRTQALSVIEALRAGVPTRQSTRSLPDARKNVTDQIVADLAAAAGGNPPPGRIVWGEYGQGKTHLLTTIEHAALDRGFAVSRVSLSRDVSLHNPFSLYGRLASILRVHDSAIPGLHTPLLRTGAHGLPGSPLKQPDRYGHPLPALLLEDFFYTADEDRELLYGGLVGARLAPAELRRIHRTSRGEALPKFERFRAASHATAFFGVMADAIRYCGYKGWVILLDELELLLWLGRASRLAAYMNLEWLLDWSGDRRYPIYFVAGAAKNMQSNVMISGSGRRIPDQTAIPELAAAKLDLVSQQRLVRLFDRTLSPQCPIIGPIHSDALRGILGRIVELHGAAYDWPAHLDIPEIQARCANQPVRTMIRATVEALDLRFLHGDPALPELADLTEYSLEEAEDFFVDDREDDAEPPPGQDS
ncbi:MAG: DUF2791 family P-loop domain-containing protein [Candidatus Sericytochromatia bacterium]|nr:DUF2791 family P-loop domain-containing protein [Candidatus Tanganyikabacteria bacterium]